MSTPPLCRLSVLGGVALALNVSVIIHDTRVTRPPNELVDSVALSTLNVRTTCVSEHVFSDLSLSPCLSFSFSSFFGLWSRLETVFHHHSVSFAVAVVIVHCVRRCHVVCSFSHAQPDAVNAASIVQFVAVYPFELDTPSLKRLRVFLRLFPVCRFIYDQNYYSKRYR